MSAPPQFGRIAVGGAAAAVVAAALEAIDKRLALYFVLISLAGVLLAYRSQFAAQLAQFAGFVRSLK